ncbi:MAG TPA: 4-hydroxy-3-methylbut-2-enyl diphosphate reductase [Actinomycetota bacterium]|nr:4-hydroxy-3-methylbut-2-enyl diphosphate reductase [Actinomycetota bacterium]
MDKARKILLAAPRGWCAGVDRAVEIVDVTLARYGPPIYVRKQIVHNQAVVAGFAARGVVFVDSEEEVPEGAVCVFSAHGVSPAVHDSARRRNLTVVDATCPLVTKVHVEARRFAKAGRTIFLVGHTGHEEVEGTAGEAPGQVVLIDGAAAAAAAEAEDPGNVAYLTQTTLGVDETSGIVDILKRRFPAIAGPRKDDICYASQNRQEAVKALAARSDLMLIVGSDNSSNSNRLVEVSREAGSPAHLISDESAIDPRWLDRAQVVGVSSGASTPEHLVDGVVAYLRGHGFADVEELAVATEDVHFPLPAGIA